MATIKTVGIKDLKNNLSAYLREVRRGTRIVVSDRQTIVAEIHEPGAIYALPESQDPVLAAWIEAGVIVPASRKKTELPVSPFKCDKGSALRLLDADRSEGGR